MENGIPTTVLAPDNSEQEAWIDLPHVAPAPRVLVRCPACRQLEHAPATDTSWCYCRPGGTLMRPVRR